MKKLIGNLSIEVTDKGDIIIGKDGQKYMTIKNDGTIEFQGQTDIWSLLKLKKISLQSTSTYSGAGTEVYMSGTKLCFAGKNSEDESQWFYLDFDNLAGGLQTSITEP